MAIDDALMEHVADFADKLIDIDLGTSQAQGGLTTHGDEMFALAAIETSVVEVADLLGIATPEHLVYYRNFARNSGVSIFEK